MTLSADEVWRDYETDGVPGSGAHQPVKREIRAWAAFFEAIGSGGGPGLGYATVAEMQLDIAHPANTLAIVYADPNPANNGLYQKVGGSGTGNWTRIGDMPNEIIVLTDLGTGTANAIIASAPMTPTDPGSKLYLFTPLQPNTAATTINVNGAGAKAIKNAFGVDLVTGSLLANSQVLMAWSVDHYQLLVSANVDGNAILASAVAAANAAASSATDAANSANTAQGYALAAGAAAARFARVATTANITLSGLVTVDGVTLVANDKVLAKNQTAPAQNGIYVAVAGAWTRATDFNAAPVVANGAVVNVSQGTIGAGSHWVLSSPDVPIVVGTSALNFAQTSLLGDVNTLAFQQDGPGTVPVPVARIIKEWRTLQMYGGGPEKTSAQNATAFAAARDGLLLKGGTLTVTPGNYQCDPVNFVRSDVMNGSMIIEGVSNVTGPASNNAVILFPGSGSGTFWNFDSPAAGAQNGTAWTLKNLYFYASSATYTGSLISSSTPVTDASKITGYFVIENCVLGQNGTTCILLNLGKTQISSVHRCVFGNGQTQILGQQGQTVAGIAQARQSTTVDIRKCTFNGAGGWPILYGGEGWGLYDNAFEGAAGNHGRAFSTNANYPFRNMTWINNWFGDFAAFSDQMMILFGYGFVFVGNYVGGANPGTGWNAMSMQGVKGFDIRGNVFDGCSAAIASDGAHNDFGAIENNVYNVGTIATGVWGSSVSIIRNGPYP